MTNGSLSTTSYGSYSVQACSSRPLPRPCLSSLDTGICARQDMVHPQQKISGTVVMGPI